MGMQKFRFNPLIIALYMLPALGWWAYLLWKNYHTLYQREVKLLVINSNVKSHDELVALPQYAQITEQYRRNCNMIIGEGTVFFLFLVGGLWYVYQAWQKERTLSKRQQNFQLSISHELRTPVTAMQLVFDTIRQRADKLKPEQLASMAESGKRESVRLQTLVDVILYSGQLENKWRPRPKAINMQTLITESVQSVQVLFPNTFFDVSIEPDAKHLFADEQGIRHTVLNLLENAAKYSPEQSKVQIKCAVPGDQFLIQVLDEGVGIPASERTKVFDKFYRIGNEDTRQTNGTGLGLYVVKQIVDAHKGKITIQDRHPKGSIFTVSLPITTH